MERWVTASMMAPRVCSVLRVGTATMLSFLLNLKSIYMQWRLLGPNICLLILSVLAAHSPPSGFNDPKSRAVDFVNPCVQSHFPMPAPFITRTMQAYWERWGLAQRLWRYDTVDCAAVCHDSLGRADARELRVGHAV